MPMRSKFADETLNVETGPIVCLCWTNAVNMVSKKAMWQMCEQILGFFIWKDGYVEAYCLDYLLRLQLRFLSWFLAINCC